MVRLKNLHQMNVRGDMAQGIILRVKDMAIEALVSGELPNTKITGNVGSRKYGTTDVYYKE